MADDPLLRGPISVVGLHGGHWFGHAAGEALRQADVLLGHRRQLDLLPPEVRGSRVELWGRVERVLEVAAARSSEGEAVCILASGDPGFFGLVRLASARLGRARLQVHPAPSSVALAFARVSSNWDDALIASAHGRSLDAAVDAVLHHPKVAVLVSADNPAQALGQALVDLDCPAREVAVCSRLGEPDEHVWRGDLAGLAAGAWDPLSVVVLQAQVAGDTGMGLVWGRSEDDFAHRDGMITKAEVRAVALGKLAIPAAGVLWDVGAGSGSLAIECARLAPALQVFAVERRPDDAARISANAAGTPVVVVHGEAPAALLDLPDPDRVFVGGGGIDVLEEVLRRLRPGGAVVAVYAALARADAAARRLGHLAQIAVSRGVPVGPDGSLRLEAANPVFVCWGPLR